MTKFKSDDRVIIDWSSGAKYGWVTQVLPPPPLCDRNFYRVLQADGSEVRVAERLLLPRDID